MKTIIHLDYESRSTVDLRKTGVYPYAADPTTDLWCAAYAVNDGPVSLWVPGEPCPAPIAVGAGKPDVEFHAHNAAFERIMTDHIATARYGWPVIPLTQWRCTMAMAYAMALPGKLDSACKAVGLGDIKDMKGHNLMIRMSKPRRVESDGTVVWWEDDERKQKLFDYCRKDVIAERALEKRILPLRPAEQTMWFLDQIINDRGVNVDTALCDAAKKIVSAEETRLNTEMKAVTGGIVGRCSNVNELKTFLRSRLPDVDSLSKDIVEELLALDLDDDIRRALELRQEAGKASVRKINSLVNGCGEDGRHRGMFQYHGASTGRWAGRRFQPQNIKRPLNKDADTIVKALMTGDAEYVRTLYDHPLTAIGDAVRSMATAGRGNDLIAADFAGIESRVLSWLAGNDEKLRRFAAADRGEGPDNYQLAYAAVFGGRPEDVWGTERQVGKVKELAFGFGGGPGAFVVMQSGYGVDISERYDFLRSFPEFSRAEEAWEQRGKGSGMGETMWVAGETVKIRWRDNHPKEVQFWWDLERAALDAVREPGKGFGVGRIEFKKAGSFLWCRLPNGRAICYPYPSIEWGEMPWDDDNGKPAKRQQLRYHGIDSRKQGGKWEKIATYGGKLCENVVQATARDFMADAMVRVEKAGYPVVLHVHDEIVSEVPKGFGSLSEFEQTMMASPPWGEGCPIAVEGWRGHRYRK